MKFVLIFCAFILATSCTKKESVRDPNTFVVRVPSEPPNIDPALGVDTVSIDIMNNLGDGLVSFDRDMKAVPALAESYEISKDGRVFTFKIRKGVVWSDDVPLTAQHFVESWERILSPKTAGEYAYFLYDIRNAEAYNSKKVTDFKEVGIKALDDSTLEVTLQQPAVYWINMPACAVMFPVRADLEKKFGNRFMEPPNFVGIGPYILKEWEHDKKMVLERNEKFWDKAHPPAIKNLVVQIIEDPSTAVSLFEKGQIDFMRRVPSLQVDKFKDDKRFHYLPYLRGYYYGFNTKKKPFDDVRVRKAFTYAIDREEVVKVLRDQRVPTASWIPQGLLGYNEAIGLKFDPVKAKKLLAEAGYPEGKGFPKFRLGFDTREDNKTVAENILAQWKKVLGVAPEVQSMEWKVYLDALRSDAPEVFRLGWGADYPDANNFMDLFYGKSGNNHTRWSNANFENFVKKAGAELDPKKRQAHFDQAQKVLLEDDVAIAPIFQENINYLLSDRVKSFYLDAMSNLFVRHYSM